MESTFSCCAYCWKNEESWDKLLCYTCDGCMKRVHYDCIRSVQPSSLLADTFFSFRCEACGDAGKEEFTRSNISWHNVVMLALYNLHKTGQGIHGYFHWKSHVGAFIDQHWSTLFGYHRKKTTVWMGTVAGTLSIGCPEYFLSGTHIGLQGHWRLTKIEPPTPNSEKKKQTQRKKRCETPVELNPEKRKCRRAGENALAAAVELKEKRSTLIDIKELKRKGQRSFNQQKSTLGKVDDIQANTSKRKDESKLTMDKSGEKKLSLKDEFRQSPAMMDILDEAYLSDGQISIASSELSFATNSSYSSSLKSFVKDEDVTAQWEKIDSLESIMSIIKKEDEDFDMDISGMVSENLIDPRPPSPDVDIILGADIGQACYEIPGKSPVKEDKSQSVNVKQELQSDTESEWPSERNLKDESDSDSDEEDSVEEEERGQEAEKVKQEVDDASVFRKVCNRKKKADFRQKRRKIDDTPPPTPPMQLKRISVFEEGELLQKLNDAATKQTLRPELAQFRRKLICNQTNREFGLPVFDLENQMHKLARSDKSLSVSKSQQLPFFPKLPTSTAQTKETRDLDRFMIHDSQKKLESRSYTNFYQRLVGLKDHELTPVVSPYTTRVLLPFIWRNFDISHKPLKLRLLQEIQAYPHRNEPSWVQPRCPPIDYCYLRPEHVPSVNALCREFFWPGIDVSECLQYPDFSCVVLYRKIVIAFAFMVPDRGYNEAYISFIFTHPEWRGAGIGTFMLYHLIQTCMGKDVLLHVSVTNPAMLLYQKFGFKCQELILNFYHKYFPLNSKESLHAFLMRLSR